MIQLVSFPVIAPLIRRHAEDAAFYWSQHDASAYSPRLTLAGLARFSHLLAAHLEGIDVAGPAGWGAAFAALERWKQPGEAFVCAYMALSTCDDMQLDALLAQVRARPDELLRALISALTWVPPAQALRAIQSWSGPDSDPLLQTAAWRAAALMGPDALQDQLQALLLALSSSTDHVRSAACRAAGGGFVHATVDAALSAGMHDPAMAVRAEAAIAFGRRIHFQAELDPDASIMAAETLWLCVVAQVKIHTAATGWYRKQAARRLNRWVKHLAGLVPIGHPKLDALLRFMPARVALHFIVCHGDPAYLPHVVAQMRDFDTARYAGWVWQTLTGVDLRASGMALDEPASEDGAAALSEARLDADLGLVFPNADAIGWHPCADLHAGQRYLLGQVLTPEHALTVLEDAVQAQRSIAAHYLGASAPDVEPIGSARIFIRSAAPLQMLGIKQLREQIAMQQERT